jgi:hypothetical protein
MLRYNSQQRRIIRHLASVGLSLSLITAYNRSRDQEALGVFSTLHAATSQHTKNEGIKPDCFVNAEGFGRER